MASERAGRKAAVRRVLPVLAALVLWCWHAAAAGAEQQRVAVLLTSTRGPFLQAAEALTSKLAAARPDLGVTRFELGSEDDRSAAVIAAALASHPTLVVSVGSRATGMILKRPEHPPLVFTMVLYPSASGYVAGANVTGVALDVPLDLQFSTLRALVPSARRVGVLYNRDETGAVVAAAHGAARREGLALHTLQIDDPGQVPTALPTFLTAVDTVWTVADSHVVTPEGMEALILNALGMKIPVFGLSASQVRLGALAAFDHDYADVGTQSAELVLRVLNGEAAATIPVANARKVSLSLNGRSARHLGIEIPADVRGQATEVIP